MRSKSRVTFVVLWIVANVVFTGCMVVPLPPSRHPVGSRKLDGFPALKKSHPTRSEVVAKFGQPEAYFDDLHVACYRVNSVTHRGLVLMFLIPTGVNRFNDFDLMLIRFDENDRLKNYEVVSQSKHQQYRETAEWWLKSTKKGHAKP
ncbi:MAG TPA: hypothetical protein VN625_11655 [Desulfuromonadaceae bacterium]|nr:hypothetical protein [Desulfuromonadaceae bacterium]